MNHEDLCIKLYEGLIVYTRRTHAPLTALILFSAVDMNNLAFTTIGIFYNRSIFSLTILLSTISKKV